MKKEIARLQPGRMEPARLDTTGKIDVLQSLETAFLAFLNSKTNPIVAVPVERRVFLTVAESAEFTGLPLAYLRRLIAEGTLKAFKAGPTWRIPRTELEALPHKLTQVKEELNEGQIHDLAANKLRRLGLLPPADLPEEIQ